MRKSFFVCLSLLALLFLGCTPVAPTPRATPVPLVATPIPVVATPALSPKDATWSQVVAAAKREGKVTIYSTYFVGDVGRKLVQDFREEYGIQLEILAVGGRQSLEKIRVEHQIKKPIADILNSAAGSVTELTLLGLASSVWQELPDVRDKGAFVVDPIYSPGGEIIQFTMYVLGPTINTKLVKPQEEPTSYKDLLDPRWYGKLLLPDPAATGSTAPFYLPLYYKVLDMDYWRRLAQQKPVIWSASTTEAVRMVARGEYPFWMVGSPDVVSSIIAEGAPLKKVSLEEGDTTGGHMVAAVKNSPHPNAAKVFINWLLNPQGQASYGREARATMVRKDVPDFELPAAQIKPKRILLRTWEFEEWANKEMKLGTVAEVFGRK